MNHKQHFEIPTCLWLSVNIHRFIFYFKQPFIFKVQERGRQGYVEKKLKTDLERELAYIEERDKLEQETKEYFGEKMYATLKEIKESRERALVIDSGNP